MTIIFEETNNIEFWNTKIHFLFQNEIQDTQLSKNNFEIQKISFVRLIKTIKTE